MVLTDQIMAGVYSNFFTAIWSIAKEEGILGFYKGWFPALAQKIPSYALTWMFFQQFKTVKYIHFPIYLMPENIGLTQQYIV